MPNSTTRRRGSCPAGERANEENDGMSNDAAHNAPPLPPEIYLVGEAGFTPVFPKVGEAVTYYWSEANNGGQHPDTYHARVIWKVDEQVIDDKLVDCTPLAHNSTAYRTTDLSAPSQE